MDHGASPLIRWSGVPGMVETGDFEGCIVGAFDHARILQILYHLFWDGLPPGHIHHLNGTKIVAVGKEKDLEGLGVYVLIDTDGAYILVAERFQIDRHMMLH